MKEKVFFLIFNFTIDSFRLWCKSAMLGTSVKLAISLQFS